MPTYEYECSACGHHLEIFQSMKDKVLETCPQCHKKALQRLIGSGSGIIFKGKGFYQTDYKKAADPSRSSSAEKDKGHSCFDGCPHRSCPSNPASKD